MGIYPCCFIRDFFIPLMINHCITRIFLLYFICIELITEEPLSRCMIAIQEKKELDPIIDWVTHEQASDFLGIHITQYRKDASLLHDLGLIDREKYSKGISRDALEILAIFRELSLERGRKSAAKEIIKRVQNGG